MKTFTSAEVDAMTNVTAPGADQQCDNLGQIIVYTGIFCWKDDTFRDEPDPTYDDEG